MPNEQLVCQKCGKVGGFFVRGGGWIICPSCGQWHMVPVSGKIFKVGKAEPWLLPFLKA